MNKSTIIWGGEGIHKDPPIIIKEDRINMTAPTLSRARTLGLHLLDYGFFVEIVDRENLEITESYIPGKIPEYMSEDLQQKKGTNQ